MNLLSRPEVWASTSGYISNWVWLEGSRELRQGTFEFTSDQGISSLPIPLGIDAPDPVFGPCCPEPIQAATSSSGWLQLLTSSALPPHPQSLQRPIPIGICGITPSHCPHHGWRQIWIWVRLLSSWRCVKLVGGTKDVGIIFIIQLPSCGCAHVGNDNHSILVSLYSFVFESL